MEEKLNMQDSNSNHLKSFQKYTDQDIYYI